MTPDECTALATSARVATLATIDADGAPNLVPFVFAIDGVRMFGVVDDKPKRTTHLARLHNIRRDPRVTIMFQHYDEDWSRLWWVKARGAGRVTTDATELAQIVARLRARYDQYSAHRTEQIGLMIEVQTWSGWRADA